jgi:hypothetical protein
MPEEKLVTFHIDVLPTDESLEQEQLDEFSRDLYQELKDSKAEDVKLASKGAVPRWHL